MIAGAVVVFDEFRIVSGTLNPDCTGRYQPAGDYNGKPSFEKEGGGWFIWWNGTTSWLISTVRGSGGVAYWTRTDPSEIGAFNPVPPASGIATVS